MIRYAFDLYPRSDPKDGTRIRRLAHLQAAEYRADGGTNSGSITLRANSPDGDDLDPEGLQYIRVVRINTAVVDGGTLSGFSELVVGGFFLENGDYQALSKQSEKLLTFTGAGTLSYLDRAIMAHQSYLTSPFIGHHPFDDRWRLWAAGTGNELGAILWRVITELQEAGRPQNPIPDLVIDFTYLIDSNAVSWSASSGDFEAQVGERVLMVVKRLMEMGLWVEMDPDTFELRAYEPGTHQRDRTGGAFGANVVRFQSPTDGTTGTSSIKSDATRGLAPLIVGSDVMVGANDVYEWVNATDVGVPIPSSFVWERSYRVEDTTGGSFEAIGTQQLQARADAGDVVRLRGKLGNSPTTGYYLPFEHVRVDDIATLHNGTGQWDWNEAEEKVAAVSILLREGGDWDFLVDLGSQYASIESRAFAIAPVGAHSHPIPFCDPIQAASETVQKFYNANDAGGDDIAWNGSSSSQGPGLGANGTSWYMSIGTGGGTTEYQDTWAASPGSILRISGWTKSLEDSSTKLKIAFFSDPPGTDGSITKTVVGSITDLAVGPGSQSVWAAFGPTDVVVPGGAQSGALGKSGGIDFDEITIALVSVLDPGDMHEDLVGTGKKAARCGHAHHVLRTTAPTVDDDEDAGYPVTTLWTDTVTGLTYVLVDASAGAADWLLLSHPQDHAAEHADGGGDELAVEGLPTSETDTDLRLAPDGSGGVEWAATGGGGSPEVKEAGASVVAAADTFDFGHGLDVGESPAGEANVAVDEGELDHNLLTNLTTGNPHTQYSQPGHGHGATDFTPETWQECIDDIGGLVHRWKFETAAGTTVEDEVGTLDLTLSGTHTLSVAGKDGNAVRFSGGGKAQATGQGNCPVGAGDRTIVVIYRTNGPVTTSKMPLVEYGVSGTNRLWWVNNLNEAATWNIGCLVWGDDHSGTAVDLEGSGDGQWHLAAFWYDGARAIGVYLDGETSLRNLGADLNTSGAGNFKVAGTMASGNNFNGDIDDVLVFDHWVGKARLNRLFMALFGPS